MEVIKISVKRDIVESLRIYNKDLKELEREAKVLLAIKLFKEGVLSLEQAAEFAELPLQKFIDELKTHNVPILEYDESELEEELASVNSL